jgi:hypothetical protein
LLFDKSHLKSIRANSFGQGSGDGTSENGYRVNEKIAEAGMSTWREQLCDLDDAGENY